MFGMTDQNAGAPVDANRFDLLFALFDNIRVTEIPGAGLGANSAVPEPTSLVLTSVMGIAGLVCGRRRSSR